MRILVIEDNEKLATLLAEGLGQEGYAVDVCHDGLVGERQCVASQTEYDLLILDLHLPGKDGVEVCKSIRAAGNMLPILMLTARDTVENKVTGLDSGADDYLVKPFALSELLSRVRALSRRQRTVRSTEMIVGDVKLIPATQEVYINEEKIDLTLKEFRILEFFMQNSDEVITRQRIIDHLWGMDFNPFSRAMDVHISNLRNKLHKNHDTILETIHGSGYRLRS
jgi:DNA-binding response OmpR family regulator